MAYRHPKRPTKASPRPGPPVGELSLLEYTIRQALAAAGRYEGSHGAWVRAQRRWQEVVQRHAIGIPPEELVAMRVQSWGCLLEVDGDHMVITQPGWTPPPPVAIQGKLF